MTVGRIPVIEGGIQPTIFDAKADILTATAADTPARLAVGSNDQVLTADSSTATGLKWATPATPTPTYTGVALYRATTQTFTSPNFTAVIFDAEELDSDGFHSNTTNNTRITIPTGKGGKYLITAQVCISSANTSQSRLLTLYKNGSNYGSNYYAATSSYYNGVGQDFAINFSVPMALAAGDYIELYYYQNSGVTITSEQYKNYFTATYLGA